GGGRNGSGGDNGDSGKHGGKKARALWTLKEAVAACPSLRGPLLAAAVLQNPAADAFRSEALALVAAAVSSNSSTVDAAGMTAPAPSATDANWQALADAAHAWLLRAHGDEPAATAAVVELRRWDWSGMARFIGFGDEQRHLGKAHGAAAAAAAAAVAAQGRRDEALSAAARDATLLLSALGGPAAAARIKDSVAAALGDCWAARGDDAAVLQSVCRVLGSQEGAVADPLKAAIVDRMIRLASDAALSRDLSAPGALAAVCAAVRSLRYESAFARRLVLRLTAIATTPAGDSTSCSSASGDNGGLAAPALLLAVDLRSVLSHGELWHDLLVWSAAWPHADVPDAETVPDLSDQLPQDAAPSGTAQRLPADGELPALLAAVRETLAAAVQALRDGSVTLATLQDELHFAVVFLRLLDAGVAEAAGVSAVCGATSGAGEGGSGRSSSFGGTGSGGRSGGGGGNGGRNPIRVEAEALLRRWEPHAMGYGVRLAQLQSYVAFACGCGIPIDAAAPRAALDGLQSRGGALHVKELSTAFDGICALPWLPWLHDLRHSELFLTTWRSLGAAICTERGFDGGAAVMAVAAGTEAGAVGAAGASAGDADDDDNEEEDEDEEMDKGDDEDDNGGSDDDNVVAAAAVSIPPVATAAPAEGAAAGALSQEDVCDVLVPRLRQLWWEMAVAALDGSLLADQALSQFGGIVSEEKAAEELRLLLDVGSAIPAPMAVAAPNAAAASAGAGAGAGEAVAVSTAAADTAINGLAACMLLRRALRWLPGLLAAHDVLAAAGRCATSLAADATRQRLMACLAGAEAGWATLTLGAAAEAVRPLEPLLPLAGERYMEAAAQLGQSRVLAEWLLEQPSSEEFDRLMQVCRPCTDEPRLLTAMASLVHVRTVLRAVLYPPEPHDDLEALLAALRTMHLANAAANFGALLCIFERQTRSPGRQALYDLRTMWRHGEWIFRAALEAGAVAIEEAEQDKGAGEQKGCECSDGGSGGGGGLLRHLLADLLELRSKLVMVEAPTAVDGGDPDAGGAVADAAMVEAFVAQLSLATRMADALSGLCRAGHERFQRGNGGYEVRRSLARDGAAALQADLRELEAEAVRWAAAAAAARDRHYALNSFTNAEMLRLRRLLSRWRRARRGDAATGPAGALGDGDDDGRRAAAATAAAVDAGRASAVLAEAERVLAAERTAHTSDAEALSAAAAAIVEIMGWPTEWALTALRRCGGDPDAAVGFVLAYEQHMDAEVAKDVAAAAAVSAAGHNAASRRRAATAALAAAERRAAAAAALAGGRRAPVFAAYADGPGAVLTTVLSVFVRRGRLPEPGEVLFCSEATTEEEIDLLLSRWFRARRYGRGDAVFCAADAHRLPYTLQCGFVERLRARLAADGGAGDAATLLVVSGRPDPAILSHLSAHTVALPPLSADALRAALAAAYSVSGPLGETVAVASDINGGGKTHFVMRRAAERQSDDTGGSGSAMATATKREAVATTVATTLTRVVAAAPVLFHLDLAHALPVDTGTMLFELLVVGMLRDPVSSRVHRRRRADAFYIELPAPTAAGVMTNTVPASAAAVGIAGLPLAGLFPAVQLRVDAAALDLCRPMRGLNDPTRIRLADDAALREVPRWLAAAQSGTLLPGSAAFEPRGSGGAAAVVSQDAFRLLQDLCRAADGSALRPSWNQLRSVVSLLHHQLSRLEHYPLMARAAMQDSMEELKSVFVRLVVATCRDFAVRSVPQLPPPGVATAVGATGAGASDDGEEAALAALAARFQRMSSWEQSSHPVALLKAAAGPRGGYGSYGGYDGFGSYGGGHGAVGGIDILSLNKHYEAQHLPDVLRATLGANGVSLDRDWSKLSTPEAIEILREVAEGGSRGGGNVEDGYVVTADTLLKMLSILLRLQCGMPVIIMGETGCGKSALVRNLCRIIGTELHVLNIHGGTTDDDVLTWMRTRLRTHHRGGGGGGGALTLFLDEVNACNSLGLFKEIVCDCCLDGEPLPVDVRIICACNPYRRRPSGVAAAGAIAGGEGVPGLVFRHDDRSVAGTADMASLVYRVRPLPESLIDHVFDYGALPAPTERIYVRDMIAKRLGLPPGLLEADGNGSGGGEEAMVASRDLVAVLSELVCVAQEHVREASGGERSTVSLRDVDRCLRVYRWFGRNSWLLKGEGRVKRNGSRSGNRDSAAGAPGAAWEADFLRAAPDARKAIRSAVVLALAFTYHARLPVAARLLLVVRLAAAWREACSGHGGRRAWLRLPHGEDTFRETLRRGETRLIKCVRLGPGIAPNAALRENLFMLAASVLNGIPIFVVGKPGSSKSLAMRLLQESFRGAASEHPALQALPAVEVFAHQCSPMSTARGIAATFEAARRYGRGAHNTVCVVLLDEVGLAEQSPDMPLKV
ncbi:unnamed protein product, partial [Phaeothamnion confervicola]